MAVDSLANFQIVRAVAHKHVTDALVRRLEDEVGKATGWKVCPAYHPWLQKGARALAAVPLPFPLKKSRDLFMVEMGTHRVPWNAADWMATRGRRVAWAFDVWPADYETMIGHLKRYGIDALFVTAKQSADRLERAVSGCDVKWCAEPLIALDFKNRPWRERQIQVLQMGRKHEKYHEKLVAARRHKYLFEETPRHIVFPTMTEFLIGLGDTKVSVCFSSDVTHPERAGDVSTVTQRYFQSFASGCIVVGNTPPELINLFGYDPVVPADLDDPAGQIDTILASPDVYLPLVQKNLEEVRHHTTAHRVETILRELN
jgi:hypothetical protein